eukprot:m51a1_g9865 hypothetical protein (356) ;mRNA; r:49678-64261
MRAFHAHLEGLVGGKIYPQISDSQDVTFPIGYNAQCMPPIIENATILNANRLNPNATVSVNDEDMKVLKEKSDMLTQAKLDLQIIDFVKPWKDPPTLAYFISNFGPIVNCWKEFIGKRFDTAKEYEMLKCELPNYENMAKRIAFTEVSEIQDVINSPGSVQATNSIQQPLGEKFTRGFLSPYEMKRLIETVGLTTPFKPTTGPVGNPQQSRINQRVQLTPLMDKKQDKFYNGKYKGHVVKIQCPNFKWEPMDRQLCTWVLPVMWHDVKDLKCYQILVSGHGHVECVWGGYSPKYYNGEFIKTMRDWWEANMHNNVIMVDGHYGWPRDHIAHPKWLLNYLTPVKRGMVQQHAALPC